MDPQQAIAVLNALASGTSLDQVNALLQAGKAWD